jgi:hypothetical protein
MITLVLLALLPWIAPPQEPARSPAPPDPARVASALAALESAWKGGAAGERVRAIEEAAELGDAQVIAAIARGLDQREDAVRDAAVAALRYQPHPAALERLHAALRAAPRSPEQDARVAELVLAVGQHASPSSIELLADASPDRTREHTTRARIRALGRVRDRAALEALNALRRKAGTGARGGALFDADFRLALWSLTGTDPGLAPESWTRWWNEHGRDFAVAPQPPEEPRLLAQRWRALWETPAERAARGEPRRGRRGEDARAGDGEPARR